MRKGWAGKLRGYRRAWLGLEACGTVRSPRVERLPLSMQSNAKVCHCHPHVPFGKGRARRMRDAFGWRCQTRSLGWPAVCQLLLRQVTQQGVMQVACCSCQDYHHLGCHNTHRSTGTTVSVRLHFLSAGLEVLRNFKAHGCNPRQGAGGGGRAELRAFSEERYRWLGHRGEAAFSELLR